MQPVPTSSDPPGPRLDTTRLLLRRWTDADREPFAALSADPEVMRYFPSVASRAQSDAFVDRVEAGFDADGFGLWALEVKAGGAFAGFTGIWRLPETNPHAGEVEVGWRLARAHWGNGYAIEAARAAVAYGFEEAGLEQIVSMTAVANAQSRALMERLGMLHDPAEDFDHPAVPQDSPLCRHVLYRLRRDQHTARG